MPEAPAAAPAAGSSAWEEPHPGRRLAVPMQPAATGPRDGQLSGTCRGDMAAKGSRQYYSHAGRPWLVRRPPRIKVRNVPSLKQHGSPAKVTIEELDGSSSPPTAQSDPDENRPAIALISAPSVADIETDGCSATEVATQASIRETDGDSYVVVQGVDSTDSPPDLEFTDFSNHLGIMIEPDGDTDIASVTVVDTDTVVDTTDKGDMYGWEAELDRKISNGLFSTTSGSVCCCEQYQYRRANGAKRSLLHRVFSNMANTSKDETLTSRHTTANHNSPVLPVEDRRL